MQGRLKQTKVYHIFLLCLKRNDLQKLLKWQQKKIIFSSVYIIGRTFHNILLLLLDCFNRHVIASSEATVLKKSVIYELSPQWQYDANTKAPKYSWLCFLSFGLHFF